MGLEAVVAGAASMLRVVAVVLLRGMAMSDLAVYPLEDILNELKSRNLSFVMA